MSISDPIPVLEWSGGAVRAFDPVQHRTILAESLTDAVHALGDPKQVGLAVGRRAALVRQLTLPEVNLDQAEAIVRVQLDQLFPVSASELTSDFAFAQHQNGTGKRVVVTAMRTDLLKQAKHELKNLGVDVAWVAPISTASGLLARANGLDSAVLVDESVDGTGIDIVQHGDVFYSRSAPIGLGDKDLELEVQRTVASAKTTPSQVIRADDSGGLAALSRQRPSINLELAEDVSRRRAGKVRSRRNLALLLTACFVASAAYVYLDFDGAKRDIAKQLSPLQRQLDRNKKDKKNLETRLAPRADAAATLRQAFQPVQSLSDVLSVVTDHVPEGVWLTGVTVERGRNLQVRGTAKNNSAVTTFNQAMSADSRFRDFRLVFANDGKIGEQPVVLFASAGHVIGNTTVYSATKAVKK